MSDEIPDPTDLRRKLGLLKPVPVRPTVHEFAESTMPAAMTKLAASGASGITLADYEPEPREVDDAESAKISELLEGCPTACAKWLKKYLVLGNKSSASRAINYSAGIVNWWKRQHPPFAALLAFYDEEIRARWNEVAERRALEGFKEEVFKPDGSLKHTRMRQDPQFLVQMMKRVDPDWKDEQLGTQITINVVREEE